MEAEVKKAKIVFQHYIQFPDKVLILKKPITADIQHIQKHWYEEPAIEIKWHLLPGKIHPANVTIREKSIPEAIDAFEKCIRRLSEREVLRDQLEEYIFFKDSDRTYLIIDEEKPESDSQEEPTDSGPLPPFHG